MHSLNGWSRRGLLAGATILTAGGPAAAKDDRLVDGVVILIDSNEPYVMGHAISYSANLAKHFADKGAKLLIEEEVARFLAETRVQDAGPAIRLMREQAEAIRQQTVDQARRMLSSGRPQGEVIEYLANTLMNRLLHGPTQALRQAAEMADKDVADALVRLLTDERDRH